jgi:FkbM family methyltransferase
MSKQEFLSKISNTQNPKNKYLKELKESKYPILLYGMGDYANTVLKFLLTKHIAIDKVCIDDKYYNATQWNNIDVVPLSELNADTANKYNVVIGFSKFKSARENLCAISTINETYFFDSISFFDFFDYSFIETNVDGFWTTYNNLEDEKSRSILIGFINGKITSNPADLYDLVEGDQYFPSDIIHLTDRENFVDAGAYTGDTLSTFLKKTNGIFESYTAFEPDNTNYVELQKTVNAYKGKNIATLNKGVWNEMADLKFISNEINTVKSSLSNAGTISVKVDSIDNVLSGKSATFIKMDIEGAEEQAIIGATNTITTYKPKLAISMYHKPTDLIILPQLIKSLRADYKLYLRHHLHITQELVLYAI